MNIQNLAFTLCQIVQLNDVLFIPTNKILKIAARIIPAAIKPIPLQTL